MTANNSFQGQVDARNMRFDNFTSEPNSKLIINKLNQKQTEALFQRFAERLKVKDKKYSDFSLTFAEPVKLAGKRQYGVLNRRLSK